MAAVGPVATTAARQAAVVVVVAGSQDNSSASIPTTTIAVLSGGCAEADAILLADRRPLPDPLLWRWGTQVVHQAVPLPAGPADVRLCFGSAQPSRKDNPAATLQCRSSVTAAYLSALTRDALPLWTSVARQATSCSAVWAGGSGAAAGAGAWRVDHSTGASAPPPPPPLESSSPSSSTPPIPPVAVPVVALHRADGALEGAVRLNLAAARVEVCPLRPRAAAGAAAAPSAPALLSALPLGRMLSQQQQQQQQQQRQDQEEASTRLQTSSPLQIACAAIEGAVSGLAGASSLMAPPSPSLLPPALEHQQASAARALAESADRLRLWVEEAAALEREEEEEEENQARDEDGDDDAEGNDNDTSAAVAAARPSLLLRQRAAWDRQERARSLLQRQAALQYAVEAALRRLSRVLPLLLTATGVRCSGGNGNSSSTTITSPYPQLAAMMSVDACATSAAATALAAALARRAGQRPRAADDEAAGAALSAALFASSGGGAAASAAAAAATAAARRLEHAAAGRTSAAAAEVVAVLRLLAEADDRQKRQQQQQQQHEAPRQPLPAASTALEREDWPLLQAAAVALAAASRADAAPWASAEALSRAPTIRESADVVTALHHRSASGGGGGGGGSGGAARGPQLDDLHSFPLALGSESGEDGSSSCPASPEASPAKPVPRLRLGAALAAATGGGGSASAAAAARTRGGAASIPPLRLAALSKTGGGGPPSPAAAGPTSPFAAAAAAADSALLPPFWEEEQQPPHPRHQHQQQQQQPQQQQPSEGPATAALRRLGHARGESAVACDLAAFVALRQHARGEALTASAAGSGGNGGKGGRWGGASTGGGNSNASLPRPLPLPSAAAALEDERALEALVEGIEDDNPEAAPPRELPSLDASGAASAAAATVLLPPGARVRLALLAAIERHALRLSAAVAVGSNTISPAALHAVLDELLLPARVLEGRLLGGASGAAMAAAPAPRTRLHPAVWWVRRRAMYALMALSGLAAPQPLDSHAARHADPAAAPSAAAAAARRLPPRPPPSLPPAPPIVYDPVAARVRQRLLDYIAVRRPDASVFEACRELLLLLRDYLRACNSGARGGASGAGGGGGGGGGRFAASAPPRRPSATATATGVLFAAADALARVELLLRGAGPVRHWPRHAVRLMDAHVQLLGMLLAAAAADATAAVGAAAAAEAAAAAAATATGGGAATAAAYVSLAATTPGKLVAPLAAATESSCGTLAAAYLLDLLGSAPAAAGAAAAAASSAGGGAGRPASATAAVGLSLSSSPACTPRASWSSSSGGGAASIAAPATPRVVVPGATMALVLEYLSQRVAAPMAAAPGGGGGGGSGVGGASGGVGGGGRSASAPAAAQAEAALAPWADSESDEAAVRMRAWRLVADAVAFCGRMQELDSRPPAAATGAGAGAGAGDDSFGGATGGGFAPGPPPAALAAAGARLYRTIADALFRPRAGGALPPFALAQLDALGALGGSRGGGGGGGGGGGRGSNGGDPADAAADDAHHLFGGLRGLPVQLRLLEALAAAFGPASGGLGASVLMMAPPPPASAAVAAAATPGDNNSAAPLLLPASSSSDAAAASAAIAGDVAGSVPDAYVTYHFLQFARLYRLLSLGEGEGGEGAGDGGKGGGGDPAGARALAACKAHLNVLLAIAGATPLRDGALAGVFAAPGPLFSAGNGGEAPAGSNGRRGPGRAPRRPAAATGATIGGAVDGVARARRRFLRLHALEFLLRELSLEQDVRRAVLPVAASRAASLAPTPRLQAATTAPGLGLRRSSRSGHGLAAMVTHPPPLLAPAVAVGVEGEEDEEDEGEADGAARRSGSARRASTSPYRPGFDLEEDLERMMLDEDERAEFEDDGMDAGEAGDAQEEEDESGGGGGFGSEDVDDHAPPLPGAAAAVPRLAPLAPPPPPLLGLSSVAFGAAIAERQAEDEAAVVVEEEDDEGGEDEDGGAGEDEQQQPSSSGPDTADDDDSYSESGSPDDDDPSPQPHHSHPRWSVASHAAAAAARVGPPSAAEAAARAAASAAAETLSAYRLQRRRHPLYRDPALHLGAAELLLALLPAAGAPAGVGAADGTVAPPPPGAPPPPPPPLCAAAAAASAQLDALLLPTDAADTRLEAACAALRAHLLHPDNAALVSRLWQRAALAQGAVDRRRRHRLLLPGLASAAGGSGTAATGGVEAGAPLRRLLKLTAATLFEAAAACYRPGGEISRGQFGTIFAATRAFRGRTYHFALKCIDADSPGGGGAAAGGNATSAGGNGAAVAAAAAACGGAGGAGGGGAGGAHTFERVHGEVAALEALAGIDGVVPLLEYGLLMPQQQQQQRAVAGAAAMATTTTATPTDPTSTSVAPPSGPPRYCLVFPRYRCSLAAWRSAHGRGIPAGPEGRRRARCYLALFEAVAGAVSSIHSAGVVHFDLKCENVLCDPVPPEAAAGGGGSGGTPSAATRSSGGGGGGGGAGAVAVGAASAAAWLRRSRTTPPPPSSSAPRRPPTASSPLEHPPHLGPPRKLVLADFGEAVVFGPAFTLGGGGGGQAAAAEGGDEGGIGGTTDALLLPQHSQSQPPPPTAAAAAAALALARRARGTELFSAPEVLLSGAGGASADAAHPLHDRRQHRGAGSPADVWSLGCALYQLLTGTVLFESDGHAAVARVVGMAAAAAGGGVSGAPAAAAAPPPPILSPAEEALLAGHPALRDLVLFALVRDPRRRPTAADLKRRVARVREEAYGCCDDDGGL